MEHVRSCFTHTSIDARHESQDEQDIQEAFKTETDLYKKDVLGAFIKLSHPGLSVDERVCYLKKLGNVAWSGGRFRWQG